MLRRIFVILLGLVLLAALLGGCKPVTAPAAAQAEPAATAAATPEAAQEGAGMANPASVYCEQNGGKLEIRDETDGQVGYCCSNGSECESGLHAASASRVRPRSPSWHAQPCLGLLLR